MALDHRLWCMNKDFKALSIDFSDKLFSSNTSLDLCST
jgi:hypothetical protein